MSNRPVDIDGLTEELLAATPRLSEREQRVAVALYQGLADGEPVSHDRLADGVGLTGAEVAAILAGWPGVFTDDAGRVIGFWGLALPPMAHRFEVEGRGLFAWCAWDTLFLPQVLGTRARVASTCATSGAAIALTVGPDGVGSVSPPGTVLSFLRPTSFDRDVVERFCHYVLFFASDEAGRAWTARHEGTFLLSVAEGFELGRRWVERRFGRARAPRGETARR